MVKLYVMLMTALEALIARPRLRTARGATFIEYGLLAVVALAVFAILNNTFRTALQGIFTRVANSLGG